MISLSQLKALVPARRTVSTVLISAVVGGVLASAGLAWLRPSAVPEPGPPRDPRFIAIGKSYAGALGPACAAAWNEGAGQLDAGKGLSTALDAVAKAWKSGRAQLFDKLVAPELDKIVPEATNDADVSPSQRAAMAAAWRGFAQGLKAGN